MRYVRPTEFRLNPRQELTLLDPVVKERSNSRYTFTEEEALQSIWASGEDVRLREDIRFWEIQGTEHFQLAEHKLANEILADLLWQGVWDGKDVEKELKKLDTVENGAFHVFCIADPRFISKDNRLSLGASPTFIFEESIQKDLDNLVESLLNYHCENKSPLNTRQLIETILRVNGDIKIAEDDVDQMASWLYTRPEWSEIARSLWLPTDLIPAAVKPKPIRVLRVGGEGGNFSAEESLVEEFGAQISSSTDPVVRVPDPPVERHPDSAVSWTQVLRTVHLLGNYLPVPTGARFRYPRFVGRNGPLVVSTLLHDAGREGFLWLDREHHRFFGELLAEAIEWEEAGRKLLINWRPEGIVVRTGDIDSEVHREEQRHLDPIALRDLRLGRGESYRKSLVSILKEHTDGLDFRNLYTKLVERQKHEPSRSSIRTVLSQSPEFFFQNSFWRWREVDGASKEFRRRIILADLLANSTATLNDLGSLADAIAKKILETVSQ